ncbi:hypothetical protein E4T49_01210 [Aureobasidium sp. EXF-10728]|nr:hypothetical protein E4T49_01210 [Aureobasidium sp. EXF-10728]
MSQGKRPFREVSLTVTGAQFSKDRFSKSRRRDGNMPACFEASTDFKIPCNATGLSHVYNLYLVAYVDSIYVYEPQFPSQSIEQEPALVVHTDKKLKTPEEQRLYGHYADHGTRAINKLLVQLLGNEEVVAVVRDDGDVEAYYTRHIYNAIEKRAYHDSTLGILSTDIRPFFHRSVGLSAWGLAIHSTARMIAVSANTHETTVFTFALTDGVSDDEDIFPDEDEVYYHGMSGVVPPNDRRKNDVRILAHSGGTDNLPDIAFCNTGHDPVGRWLLTAGLLGRVAAWDIHSLQLNQIVSTALSPPIFRIPKDNFDGRNGVWGLLFLDPLSFRTTDTIEEALGVPSSHVGVDLEREKDNAIWDLGKTVDCIGHVRRPFKDVGSPVVVSNGNYACPLELARHGTPGPSTTTPVRRTNVDVDRSSEEEDGEEEGEESNDENHQWDSDDSDDGTGYDSAEDTHVTFPRPDGTMWQIAKPKPAARFSRGESMCGDLPCPILQLSFKDIYLYQPATSSKAWDHLPIPSTRRLFQQEVPVAFDPGSTKFGRINMYAQIPSLGIVIIATQQGRVAVLSLTQTVTRMLDYEKVKPNHPSLERSRMEKRIYGYRVDHILPLASQEEAGHRPKAGIHGIAVGPVQGTENLEDGLKRWRLLVHYQDLSVLAYEIGKPSRDQLDLSLMAI